MQDFLQTKFKFMDHPINRISPIDGRYASKTTELISYFSEFALIKYRVYIEIAYFKELVSIPLPQLKGISKEKISGLDQMAQKFTEDHALRIKQIESKTNHDVKAVEYFIKEEFDKLGLGQYKEFIHFGLTSQDINNTATPLLTKDAFEKVYVPLYLAVSEKLRSLANQWKEVPMLARTHGQPASPTRLGKEISVFISRLDAQLMQVNNIPFSAKFGGATGNMNAHFLAYPEIDWHFFARNFVENTLGLKRSFPTTQIEHYDNFAAFFQGLSRINTILIDLCRDIWSYISMDYFKQKVIRDEVGSSAMPHKVNPIDFENAEGNLGLANAMFTFLAAKLPISRLQRDLTDSTVLRNIGIPFGYTIIAFHSILKGLDKIILNERKLRQDLDDNWTVTSEGIQNILRREGYPEPFETLKELTRGKEKIKKEDLLAFISSLNLSEEIKDELRQISPFNYTGK